MKENAKSDSLDRRRFVAATVLSAAIPAGAAEPAWATFTPAEAALVEALCDRIIPADEDPGAKDAGVVRYIDRQLAGPLKRFKRNYREGLPALDESCRDSTGHGFLDLDPAGRTRFLESVERGQVKGGAWKRQSAAAFFAMVIDHTMQGFYGSPKYGGNRGRASWKMLGIADIMNAGEHAGHAGGRS